MPMQPSRRPVAKPHRYTTQKSSHGTAILFLLLLLAAGGAYWYLSSRPPQKAMRGDDGTVKQMIRSQGSIEVDAWLAESNRSVRGMDRSAVLNMVRQLQSYGAVRVLAFGRPIVSQLAIELPDDPEARARLFAWQEQWQTKLGQPAATEAEQIYLLIDTPEENRLVPSLPALF